MGLIPSGGTHIRMPRQIPWAIAMELLLTGESIDAKRAYEVGLINRVVPMDELMSTATQLAERLCTNGPLAMHTAKEIAIRCDDASTLIVEQLLDDGRGIAITIAGEQRFIAAEEAGLDPDTPPADKGSSNES